MFVPKRELSSPLLFQILYNCFELIYTNHIINYISIAVPRKGWGLPFVQGRAPEEPEQTSALGGYGGPWNGPPGFMAQKNENDSQRRPTVLWGTPGFK